MGDILYTVVLQLNGENVRLHAVDPDRYSYLDLLMDVRASFASIQATDDFKLTCKVGDVGKSLEIEDDNDVLQMFRKVKTSEFTVFVEKLSTTTTTRRLFLQQLGELEEHERRAQQNVVSDDVPGLQQHVGVEEVPRLQQFVVSDEVPGLQHVGVEFVEPLTGDEDSSDDDFEAVIDEEDNRSEAPSSESEEEWELPEDAELSGYESNDNVEASNPSDDEFEDDPVHGKMDLGGRDFQVGDSGRIQLARGQIFRDVKHFRMVLKDYIIQEGIRVVRDKNDKQRVRAHCDLEGCKWRIHASLLQDGVSFMIKKCPTKHSCTRESNAKEVNARWIASKLVDMLRSNPDANIEGIRHELAKYTEIQPTYMQIYRGRKFALEEIHGSHADMFKYLPKYAAMVKITNTGTVCTLQSDFEEYEGQAEEELVVPREPTFKRFFMGLKALRDGFLAGCQPFIGFDGCHLKGPYGGVLLAAVGLDANNGLYPIAFAIVETESKESWSFFFHNMSMMFEGFNDGRPWTFMTDRQKGLVEAINDIVPHAINRKCARHICANFRSRFPGGAPIKKWFWVASRSYTAQGYNFAMSKIKEINENAYKYLLSIRAELWCRFAFDLRLKNDHVTNNIAESFNHWIGKFRGLSFMQILEELRSKLMNRMTKRGRRGSKWNNVLVSNVVAKINKTREEACSCKLFVASTTEYQVQEKSSHFIVNLANKTCDCRVWDLSGIPCKHALVAISYMRQKSEAYTICCWSKAVCLRAYNHVIKPIPHKDFWPQDLEVNPSNLLPPLYRRLPARPKNSRRKEPTEGEPIKRSGTTRCSKCKVLGHNAKGCKGPEANVNGTEFQASNNPEKGKRKYKSKVGKGKGSKKQKTKAKNDGASSSQAPIGQSDANQDAEFERLGVEFEVELEDAYASYQQDDVPASFKRAPVVVEALSQPSVQQVPVLKPQEVKKNSKSKTKPVNSNSKPKTTTKKKAASSHYLGSPSRPPIPKSTLEKIAKMPSSNFAAMGLGHLATAKDMGFNASNADLFLSLKK